MELDVFALSVLRFEKVLSFLGIPAKTVFCEDFDFIALALYRLANDFFTQPKAVDWCSINGRYTNLNGLLNGSCLLYTSPSPRDRTRSRMPSSA